MNPLLWFGLGWLTRGWFSGSSSSVHNECFSPDHYMRWSWWSKDESYSFELEADGMVHVAVWSSEQMNDFMSGKGDKLPWLGGYTSFRHSIPSAGLRTYLVVSNKNHGGPVRIQYRFS